MEAKRIKVKGCFSLSIMPASSREQKFSEDVRMAGDVAHVCQH